MLTVLLLASYALARPFEAAAVIALAVILAARLDRREKKSADTIK